MADEQRKFWGDFFDKCDKDKSGTMTVDELKAKLQQINPDITDAQVCDMFVGVDTDGSKDVTKKEFLTEMMKKNAKESKAEYEKIFQKWDKDGSGTLTRDELKKAVLEKRHFNEDEIDDMLAQADKNGDGVINYCEFMKYMCGEQSSQKAS
ncbi:hypothetical protein FSP39_018779 [Pinctada imbricata]|uniref:Sulfhydryl light chain n=1 Tax=Pinctada imbricata TaxID=66713 RepID=A0AA89C4S4_PINIB|nr:hypothetical protein FSP39_018779 [Pinctada imbricata]